LHDVFSAAAATHDARGQIHQSISIGDEQLDQARILEIVSNSHPLSPS
jgi:hypothetical protein